MKSNLFENSQTTLPENDPRVVRIEFDKNDLGARKSHLPKNIKNDNSIVHVKGS